MVDSKQMYNEKIYTYIFTAAFVIYSLIYVVFGASQIKSIYHVDTVTSTISFICIGTMGVLALTRKRSLRMNFMFYLLVFASVYAFLKANGRSIILFSVVSVFAAQGINLKPVLIADVVSKSVTMILILVLYYSNQIQSLTELRYDSSGIASLRNSLGFSHYNVLGALILSLVVEIIFIRRKKISFFEIFLFSVIIFWINSVANPRAAMISSLLGLLGIAVIKLFSNLRITSKPLCITVASLPFVFAILSYYVSFNFVYGDPKWMLINKFFSDRLNILHDYLTKLPISPLGQTLPTYMSSDTIVVDNVYLFVLLQFGALLLFVALIAYSRLLYRAMSQNDFVVVLVVLCELVFGMSESTVYYLSINFTLLLLLNSRTGSVERTAVG